MSLDAMNIDTGRLEPCAATDALSVPVLGYANDPAVELRLLKACMSDCLKPARRLLERYRLTFEQELALYNAMPVGATAADISRDELAHLVREVSA